MTQQPKSHLEIALASMQIFANDGQLDRDELQRLLDLALRDEVIDDDEKRVLANIFRQAELGDLDPIVKARIARVRLVHSIPA